MAAMKSCDADGMLEKLEVAGPGFINISISVSWLASRVQTFVVHGPCADVPKKKVIIDYSSPNVAKEMHIGHIRSTIIGDSLARVLDFGGHDIERVNHVGDWGSLACSSAT